MKANVRILTLAVLALAACHETNQPPVADAGADRAVIETVDVRLSAANSHDSDGTITTYTWTQVGGQDVALSDADGVTASFTAPATDTELRLEFRLKITDDDGASSSDTVVIRVVPNRPPVVEVLFPTPNSRFFGESIGVSGTVTMEEGEVGTSVTVAGGVEVVEAAVGPDGGWLVRVALPTGVQSLSLTATATDQLGETAQAEVSLENRPTLSDALFDFDPAHPEVLYAFEVRRRRLVSIDLSDGQRAVLYQGGFEISQAWEVALDPTEKQFLILDVSGKALHAIELETGGLRTISNATIGTGPALELPWSMALDAAHDRVLVFDTSLLAVLQIDLTSGDRAIVSDNSSRGEGEAFVGFGKIAVDASGSKAYVCESNTYSVTGVDLHTGDRSRVSGSDVGAGPSLYVVGSMAYDAELARLGLLHSASDEVITVDVGSGDRAVLSGPAASGISFGSPWELRIDLANDRYIVNGFSQNFTSDDLDAFVAVDRQSGARAVLAEETLGSGPQIEGYSAIAIDSDLQEAYVLSSAEDALFAIDLLAGHRRVVSSAAVGAGESFVMPVGLAIDLPHDRAFIGDIGAASVLVVDLATGDRSVLASPTEGSGPSLQEPAEAAYVPGPQPQLVVLDRAVPALVRIDVTTRTRSLLSDNSIGTGRSFVSPVDMALDMEGNRLLVADEGTGATSSTALIGVDLNTGERTTLATAATGGLSAHSPHGVTKVPNSNSALVVDYKGIMLVDLIIGSGVIVANDSIGTGEPLMNVFRIAVDEETGLIYGGSINLEALIAIDRHSGDRVIVSR